MDVNSLYLMWPWQGTWKQVPQSGYSFRTQSLKRYDQSFCQGSLLLIVLHVNIPWLMCSNTSITRMLCGRFNLKWIIQEFDDLCCFISVNLLFLCWSLVLESTDVNLGNAWLIQVHAQWTFKMNHSINRRFSLALQHSFTRLVPVSTPSSMPLSPWSIPIVSWSASWLLEVSTCEGIPRIVSAMIVLRSSSSSWWPITALP